MKKSILLCFAVIFSIRAWSQQDNKEYLGKLLEKLDSIKYASYYYYQIATLPYDSTPSLSYSVFKREYIQPEDKFVGANIASFSINDTSKLEYFYDGKSKAYLDYKKKLIPVDSFKYNQYPYRVVYPPFITYTKTLLKYAIETKDSITISINESKDSTLVKLFIRNKLAEVAGNRMTYDKFTDIGADDAWTECIPSAMSIF